MAETPINKIRREARSLYPVPYSDNRVSTFLSKNRELAGPELLAQWHDIKLCHVSYWQSRYGLTDAKPFSMVLPAKYAIAFTWKYDEKAGTLVVIAKTPTTSPCRSTRPIGKANWMDVLKTFVSNVAQQRGCGKVSIGRPEAEGSAKFYRLPEPEHDWIVYANMLCRDGLLKQRSIKSIIKAYKSGELDLNSLDELTEYIKNA